MITKKKRKKYYKVVIFTTKMVSIIEKQVHVNVTSCIENRGTLCINKESDERWNIYNMTDVSEYIIKPQKGKI
jgi:hypothetical protein